MTPLLYAQAAGAGPINTTAVVGFLVVIVAILLIAAGIGIIATHRKARTHEVAENSLIIIIGLAFVAVGIAGPPAVMAIGNATGHTFFNF